MTSALLLAGCQTSATNCAGWKKIPLPNDPARLVVQEPRTAAGVIAHNTFGRESGCWK